MKTKFKYFILETYEFEGDPYGEENDEPSDIDRIVSEYDEKWKNKAPGKVIDFIEKYPSKEDFKEDERIGGDYVDDDNWSPDNEIYLLSQIGLYVGNGAEDNISTEEWCDFFNDLVRAGW